MSTYRVTTPDGVTHEHCQPAGFGDWGSAYRTLEGARITVKDYVEHLYVIEEES